MKKYKPTIILSLVVLLIGGCSSDDSIAVLKKYAAESLGEDGQLVVLGGGSKATSTFGLDGSYYDTVYIDFRGSGSEKRYRARLYRDRFLSGWKREIVKLPPKETPYKAMHMDADNPRR